MFRKMKSVIDKKLIWFGFYDKTPICFFIGIPDPNQHLKVVNGDFYETGRVQKVGDGEILTEFGIEYKEN